MARPRHPAPRRLIVLVTVGFIYHYTVSSLFSFFLKTVNFECIYEKGHHTVKSIRQREMNFIQSAMSVTEDSVVAPKTCECDFFYTGYLQIREFRFQIFGLVDSGLVSVEIHQNVLLAVELL